MPKTSAATFFQELDSLVRAVDDTGEGIEHLRPLRDDLAALVRRLKKLKAEQEDLQGRRQAVTQQLRIGSEEARDLSVKLRAALQVPLRSPQRVAGPVPHAARPPPLAGHARAHRRRRSAGAGGSVRSRSRLFVPGLIPVSRPCPKGGQRFPSGGHAVPSGGHALPSGGQPPPSGGEPSPSEGQPLPSRGEPSPSGGQTLPSKGESSPSRGQPSPSGGEPLPSGGHWLPSRGEPLPSRGGCMPSGGEPFPSLYGTLVGRGGAARASSVRQEAPAHRARS